MRGTPSEFGSYIKLQAVVLEQLPRPEEIDSTTRQGWIENQGALKKALRSALCPPIGPENKAIWRKLVIDERSLDSLLANLRSQGVILDRKTRESFESLVFPRSTQQLKLVRTSIRALGFGEAPDFNRLVSQIHRLGGSLLLTEEVLYLRASYAGEQPRGEYLWILTEPNDGLYVMRREARAGRLYLTLRLSEDLLNNIDSPLIYCIR